MNLQLTERTYKFFLSDKPTIIYSNDSISISINDKNKDVKSSIDKIVVPISVIQSLYFDTEEYNSISSTTYNSIEIRIKNNNYIEIKHVPPLSEVSLYSTKGEKLYVTKTSNNSVVLIYIANFNSGVYMIKIQNVVVKFRKI